jgi:hypothetical protein
MVASVCPPIPVTDRTSDDASGANALNTIGHMPESIGEGRDAGCAADPSMNASNTVAVTTLRMCDQDSENRISVNVTRLRSRLLRRRQKRDASVKP